MEKAIYPLKNMRITQGYEEGTHIDSYAIDDAGKNTNIENVYAPFTGTIKKIYTQDANEVWLESENPVEYPDGTIDYMTVLFAHDNDISDLYVGKKIKQNEAFYQEGTAGNATGNHCHIECAKGKYIEPGWQQNEAGYYNIINAKRPEECLWLNNTNVIDNHDYNFMEIPMDIIDAPSDEEIIQALKDADAYSFVKKYEDGINHEVLENGSNFSGGQKQRLSLARALIKPCKLLVLDDCFSALDFITENKIKNNIYNLQKNRGFALIIVSQRISSIRDMNNIILLDKGRVVDSGNNDELLNKSELYNQINDIQGGNI